jgi:hypothetical protein
VRRKLFNLGSRLSPGQLLAINILFAVFVVGLGICIWFLPRISLTYRVGFGIFALAISAHEMRRAHHWWKAARVVGHHCPTCGYDLRATPERCPECGRLADSAAR